MRLPTALSPILGLLILVVAGCRTEQRDFGGRVREAWAPAHILPPEDDAAQEFWDVARAEEPGVLVQEFHLLRREIRGPRAEAFGRPLTDLERERLHSALLGRSPPTLVDLRPMITLRRHFAAFRRVGAAPEHVAAFVAACRQDDIPARFVSGTEFVAGQGVPATWAECFVGGHGWLPVDIGSLDGDVGFLSAPRLLRWRGIALEDRPLDPRSVTIATDATDGRASLP